LLVVYVEGQQSALTWFSESMLMFDPEGIPSVMLAKPLLSNEPAMAVCMLSRIPLVPYSNDTNMMPPNHATTIKKKKRLLI
jgi:hypothetical protein